MKILVKSLLLSIIMLSYSNIQAQCCAKKDTKCTSAQVDSCKQSKSKIQTETFSVEGACDMCKTRIENAALIKGVKSAEWDAKAHTITVIYNSQKVTLQAIHNAIAEVGHKTSLVNPNMEAYNKLPACCAYLKGEKSSCGHSHH